MHNIRNSNVVTHYPSEIHHAQYLIIEIIALHVRRSDVKNAAFRYSCEYNE